MFAALILLICAAAILVMVLLFIVGTSIRRERRAAQLDSQAPTLVTAMVRRLLGVYVRRPADAGEARDQCLAGHLTGRHAG